MAYLKLHKKRILWVIFFRLLLVVIITITTYFLTDSLISKDIALKIYTLSASATLLTILLIILFFSYGPLRWVIYLNIISDLVLISIGLLWTNGHDSPFIFLYNFSILSACFLEGRAGGTLSALLSTIFFGIIYFSNIPKKESFQNVVLDFFINMGSFNAIAFFGILIVQQLKLTEENLNLTLEQLKRLEIIQDRLTDSLVSGLISVDPSGRLMTVNAASERILNINLSSFIGSPLKDVWEKGDLLLDDFKKNSKSREKRYEIELKDENNVKKIIGLSIFNIEDINKNHLGYGMVFQDITEVKENERKMIHNDRLIALGEMAAGLAHEIRNPLASLTGAAQFIKEKKVLDSANERLLDIIIRESKRLNELVEKFILYARPQHAKRQRLLLKDEVDYVLSMLEKRKFSYTPKILIDIEDNLVVYGDSNQMKQVLYNILLNAYQSLFKNDSFIKITAKKVIEKDTEGSEVRSVVITIEDNGEGISPEIKDKLFNPFFTTKPEGTGLGLSVVYSIISSWGGSVDFSSEKGQGTTFVLKLPVKDE